MCDEQEQCQSEEDAMQIYIGCKVIQAKPMDEASFLATKSQVMSADRKLSPGGPMPSSLALGDIYAYAL